MPPCFELMELALAYAHHKAQASNGSAGILPAPWAFKTSFTDCPQPRRDPAFRPIQPNLHNKSRLCASAEPLSAGLNATVGLDGNPFGSWKDLPSLRDDARSRVPAEHSTGRSTPA